MIQGFAYQFFNSLKDSANNRFSPSIMAGYGPYNDIQTAISTISAMYSTSGSGDVTYISAPPLGFKFGVISNGVFTEYQYNTGNFNYSNTAAGGSTNPGIAPSGASIPLSSVIPATASASDDTTALSIAGARALEAEIAAASGGGVVGVKVNNVSVVDSNTKVANIPAASSSAIGVVQLGYSPASNVTNQFALKTSSNKAYVEIPQAYLVSAEQKSALDALVEVYENGTFITDPNMEVSSGSGGGGDYSALETRIARIEAVLGQLMGNTSADDATFTVVETT